MNSHFLRFTILTPFLACLILPLCMSGQDAATYSWFDETVGISNTGLFNGVEYREQHRTLNENHKFFLTNDFIAGTLIYNGQPYFFQPLKYNVYDEVLLINAQDGLQESLFQLINEKIDGFEIAGHQFINVKPGVNQRVQGFYEVLLENEQVQVLKKHSRYMNELRDRRFLYYEFKPENNDYELKYNDEYHEISSRRDVIKIFPELKTEIREIYSSERAVRKSNPDKFMVSLFQELSQLSQNNNATEL